MAPEALPARPGNWNKGWDYQHDKTCGDGDQDRSISRHLTYSQEWHPDPVRK